MPKEFKYPKDIKLKTSPLVEAWLEVRWTIKADSSSGFPGDPYPYALGSFYNSVKDVFGFSEELPASKVPMGMLPNVVQHRFRTMKDGWPLIQLGPGVATINFSSPYSWVDSKERILYFRNKLLEAYSAVKLEPNFIFLRYRNVYQYEYSTKGSLEFLKKINLHIQLPKNIPGIAGVDPNPLQNNLLLEFRLNEPKGVGQIQIANGFFTPEPGSNLEAMLWELAAGAINEDVPDFYNEESFGRWLDDIHAVLHDWFLGMIDGELLKEFLGKE